MSRLSPACLGLLLALSGCIVAEEHEPPTNTASVILSDRCAGLPGDVSTATIAGDTLTFTTQYGGCGSTEAWACWDGAFLESSPVQVPIVVHHADAGNCDAWLSTTRTVDLSPVIDAYADAYGGVDPMILRLDDVRVTWQP